MPLLNKGGRPQYIPWGSQDLQNLITTLPDIQEGAAIWIRKLEEEMTGKTMALGDVKALLTKVVGKEQMLDLIENAGYRGADKSTVDGRIFDQYRQKIWDSLRKAYPTRPSTAMLTGVPMKEEESAAAFVENQLRNWRMTLDKDIQGDPIMTAMFRAAILEGLPDLAKRRLEEVVGLASMTHREFVDHVIHAVERGRMEEKKQSNQEREVQRNLFQLQLEVLKNKEKSKTKEKDNDPKKMAPIMADFTWAEPGPPLHERGRGPSGSQPTVVYNFSGIPPSAVPMPVYVQGAMQGAPPQNWGQGNKGGMGYPPGNKGQGNQNRGQAQGGNIQNQHTIRQGQGSSCHSSRLKEGSQGPGFRHSLKAL
ncbi:hypothetical protein SKAU_G00212300 [Synaphobranchus kaupii]|uniref:Gag protein n=1 Tax=Synaphobranchus kaupii TaxID=118154 RepID=A0A9Q1F965_SYNKA|nr:hypothetical protein SKAU_G00212300 [Synaphobranchus kaupii]